MKIADDYAAIAQRLKEIEAKGKRVLPTVASCGATCGCPGLPFSLDNCVYKQIPVCTVCRSAYLDEDGLCPACSKF